MKKKIKRFISSVITLCLTVALLGGLTDVMERKSSRAKYEDFLNQDEDFDVLFMGTSHVIDGIYPMELWEDYGIVSYNFGGHSNRMATTYWSMENALDHTDPKLVVIDCMGVSDQWKSSDVFSFLHLSMDAFPLSVTKTKAVWDLLDDKNLTADLEAGKGRDSGEKRTKLGLIWDFSVYHSRWTELTEDDFSPAISPEKGAETKINVAQKAGAQEYSSEKMEPGTVSDRYLRMMIEDCQKRGIEVLLTYLPFPASAEKYKEANYINDVAAEYKVNYVNFLEMKDIIDYKTDLFDADSHLNASGARKVTEYLGQYIMDNYEISDRRTDEEYQSWDKDYDKYVRMKDENLKAQNKLDRYLMLLSGDDVDMVFDVRNKDIYKSEWAMDMLRNVGIDTAGIHQDTDFIIKLSGSEATVVLDNFREDGSTAGTDAGDVELRYDTSGEDDGGYSLYLDGERILTGNSGDGGLTAAVRRNGQVVDNVRFGYTVSSDGSEIKFNGGKRDR